MSTYYVLVGIVAASVATVFGIAGRLTFTCVRRSPYRLYAGGLAAIVIGSAASIAAFVVSP